MDGHTIRESQRISKSCVECGRRKIKCDKKIPCAPCVRRNIAHECKRPITRVRGRLQVGVEDADSVESTDDALNDLLKERSALRAQVAQLEIALALSRPSASNSKSSENLHEGDFEDLVPALEQFDLNIKHDTPSGDSLEVDLIRQLWEPATDPLYLLLPSRAASTRIVQWSLHTLGWIHCALRADVFIQEHEELWNKIEHGNTVEDEQRPWFALYLAVLSNGMMYMDPYEGTIHTTELPQPVVPRAESADVADRAMGIARLWYEASLKELEKSKFLKQVSIEAVQTIVLLTLCNSNFGEHQQEWLLMGLAINMARCLDMHRLGSENACPPDVKSKTMWSTASTREMGRRIWWTIVICDWLGSWTRPPSISPAGFHNSITGHGQYDHEVLPVSTADIKPANPSPVQYHVVMARLSYIFYIYIKANASHSVMKFSKAIDEINAIRRSLPLHLSSHFPANTDDQTWEQQYTWVPFQRYLIGQAIDFMQLSIARILAISKQTKADESQRYRTLASDAAVRILQSYVGEHPREYKLIWISSASAVASGIYLALEYLMPHEPSSSDISERLSLIRSAAQGLRRNSFVTVHAAKGSAVLDRLLLLCSQRQPSSGSPSPSLAVILSQLTGRSQDNARAQGQAVDLDGMDPEQLLSFAMWPPAAYEQDMQGQGEFDDLFSAEWDSIMMS